MKYQVQLKNNKNIVVYVNTHWSTYFNTPWSAYHESKNIYGLLNLKDTNNIYNNYTKRVFECELAFAIMDLIESGVITDMAIKDDKIESVRLYKKDFEVVEYKPTKKEISMYEVMPLIIVFLVMAFILWFIYAVVDALI